MWKNRVAFGISLLFLLWPASRLAQQADAEARRPSDAELLRMLAGDSASRLRAFRHSGPRLWEAEHEFFPAILACADDPDVKVRRAAVTQIGQ